MLHGDAVECMCWDVAQADWKIVERGWQAHVLGEAPHKFTSALEAIKKLRVGTLPHDFTGQFQQ